ncbi:MAG: hypothetical protein ACLUQ6_13115 [Alistipes onderdonkii]
MGADQRTRSLQLYGHTVQPRRLRRFPVLGGRQRAAGQRRFVCALPAGTHPGLYRRHVRRHPGGRGAAARRLEPQLAPLPQRQPGYFQKRALASKAEAVACCNYPGQDLVPQNYWSNPKDLTSPGLFGLVQPVFRRREWLRVDDAPRIRRARQKTVYEFETFFNQSAYLYPIQAQYFRALGVRCASMWTYTMQEYAPYHCGSHFLSLTCTPKKAASFIVAGEIYKSTRWDKCMTVWSTNNWAATSPSRKAAT